MKNTVLKIITSNTLNKLLLQSQKKIHAGKVNEKQIFCALKHPRKV